MSPEKSSSSNSVESAPEPRRCVSSWRNLLSGLFGNGPDSRWATQLMRISSDLILICDDELKICHHNRAFLKAIGHTSGSFCGEKLEAFMAESDREGVHEAFSEWRSGHAAGMRFQAAFLTKRGMRHYDVRVVRSRDHRRSFFYYMIAREAVPTPRSGRRRAEQELEPLFQGIPVAAWRTDAALRISDVFGDLWTDLGAGSKELVGKMFGSPPDSSLPGFLQGIDCADTLTGMSLHTEIAWKGESFNVTIDPFLDPGGRVLGTVGFLRRAQVSIQASQERIPLGTPGGTASSDRHHLPPWTAEPDISVVTGRVPRFTDDGILIERTDQSDRRGNLIKRRPFRTGGVGRGFEACSLSQD